MDKTLEEIRDFADRAHGEQMRKYTPDRYIVHPVRVMELCREYTQDVEILSAALLHDVLEDTPVTQEQLREFLLEKMDRDKAMHTIKLVAELTDVYVKKDFPRMNRRSRKEKEAERMAQTSDAAQTIKYADIIDNCAEIVQHDADFARVFLSECRNLLKIMTRGNPALHKRAQETVSNAMGNLRR